MRLFLTSSACIVLAVVLAVFGSVEVSLLVYVLLAIASFTRAVLRLPSRKLTAHLALTNVVGFAFLLNGFLVYVENFSNTRSDPAGIWLLMLFSSIVTIISIRMVIAWGKIMHGDMYSRVALFFVIAPTSVAVILLDHLVYTEWVFPATIVLSLAGTVIYDDEERHQALKNGLSRA